MKKLLVYSLLLLQACLWISCYKDKGNYTYHDLNEITFQNIDTTNGYTAVFGNTLSITPKIIGTLDPDGTSRVYKYEWTYDKGADPDTVISVSRDLNVKINVPPGTYVLQYKVTDSLTNVSYHIRTRVNVTTDVFEGYFVLNDVNGVSRLDMLSYQATPKTFTQYTDVLKKMGSSLPPQGKPYQVFCVETAYPGYGTPDSYYIYLLTASGTNRIQSETFAWDAQKTLLYEMFGNVPNDFKAERFTCEMVNGTSPTNLMYAANNAYMRTSNSGFVFQYLPVNAYQGGIGTFKVSPYMVTDGYESILFNMDKRTFVDLYGNTATSVNDVAPALNYPTGKDLVFMTRNYTENCHAILKDPAGSNYYIARFIIGAATTYYDQIMGTDIALATNFAVSPDLGYLFYSVGGKVYEYDLSLKTSKLMIDKGAAQITYLDFQNFFARASKTTYTDWSKLLIVGSYDPGGPAGSNGTLEQYAVQPVNAQITLVNKWTGFGKIASVSYRERN